MAIDAPTYEELQSDFVAQVIASITAYNALYGTSIPLPNFSDGTAWAAIRDGVALGYDTLYGQLEQADLALDVDTATGSDLDALLAVLGIPRKTGTQATNAVLFGRNTPDGTSVTIPVEDGQGNPVVLAATDQTGNYTLDLDVQQAATLPAGAASIIPPNASWAYGTLLAEQPGVAGNLQPGQVLQLQTDIPGVDYAIIPVVATPGTPTLSGAGSTGGSTEYDYQVVARGLIGTTLPSPTATTTTGLSTLTGTNKITVSWAVTGDGSPNYATGFDVLKKVAGVWQLLGTVDGSTTSLDDTGQGTQPYSYPSANTANVGVGGTDAESDDAYRQRAPATIAAEGTATGADIATEVQKVEGVTAAYPQDNEDGTGLILYTAPDNPVAADVLTNILDAIDRTQPFGIRVTAQQITPKLIAVAYSVTAQASFSSSALLPSIATALAGYFASLEPGSTAYVSGLISAMMGVSGVAAITNVSMTPAGGVATSGDVPGTPGVIYGLGAITASAL